MFTGRDWKWRPPPRGYTVDSYGLCESFADNSVCHYGNQCVDAHGNEELHEWKERFEYRKMRLQRACEKELYGKSYTEQLLDKLVSFIQQLFLCIFLRAMQTRFYLFDFYFSSIPIRWYRQVQIKS